ncbi:hypothetical protein Tco_0202729 [Tanacetum coccineum]
MHPLKCLSEEAQWEDQDLEDFSINRAIDQEDSSPVELVLLSVCSFPPVFFPLCEVKDLSLHHSRNLANLRGQLHKPLGSPPAFKKCPHN